jgi:hypothetical protein
VFFLALFFKNCFSSEKFFRSWKKLKIIWNNSQFRNENARFKIYLHE